MKLSARLLNLAVALILALPGAVLSRSLEGLEEQHGQAGAGAAGMLLGFHSSGWATGAEEDGMAGSGGALRRLTMPRKRAPVFVVPGCAYSTITFILTQSCRSVGHARLQQHVLAQNCRYGCDTPKLSVRM